MKWITAANLENWGKSAGAEADLPELVGDLIRGTAQVISDFRFPSGEKGRVRGFDGWLIAQGQPPFIPDGESVWEFGTSGASKTKFESDYKKRTKEVPAERRREVSFVLVSPHTWDAPRNKLTEWIAAKRALNDWKQVHVIDGPGLETWLDEQPNVAARWAKTFNVVPDGVRSTDEFWIDYGLRFEVAPNEQVVLCGREQNAKSLIENLQGGRGAINLQADSPDEVVAFAVAAIRSADPEVRLFLEAQTLIVDAEAAGVALYQKTKSGIFFPRSNASSTVRQLAAKGPTLNAVSADQPNRGHEVLERPSFYDLAKALESTGLDSHQASRVSHECGRSLTVMERTFAGAGNVTPPGWRTDGEKLIPALLGVAWDASSEGDRAILSLLARNQPYDDLERDLRPFLRMVDPPLETVGSAWKVRAPVDAFVWLGDRIGRDDFARFRQAVTEVLSVIEPDPNPDDPFSISRSPPKYSDWLRSGLVTTVLQIAALHGPARLTIDGQAPQAWVDDLVGSIPRLREDHRIFASLRDRLPYLMEASPNPLLAALEHLLEGNKLTPIFDEIDTGLSPYSRHTGVLFALETLAWDPQYLNRVCDILCRLAVIDPGGRLTNRPARSLREILLPWSPNTYATDEQRFTALDVVLKRDQQVGWQLALSLLPKDHDFSTPTSKPRFREAGESNAVEPTYQSLAVFYARLARKVIDLAGRDASRLVELAPNLERFGGEPWDEAIAAFDEFLSRAGNSDRQPVWAAIRELRDRHRRFATAEWALPGGQLEQLDVLVRSYAPPEEADDFGDLFDDWFPVIDGKMDPDDDLVLEARRHAVAKILTQADAPDRLVALAAKSKLSWSVGQAAALELSDLGAVLALLETAFAAPQGPQREMAAALANGARIRFPHEWPSTLRAWILSHGLAPFDAARLVMAWPEGPESWDFAQSLGPDVEAEYWSAKTPWRLKADGATDLNRAIENYLKVGRPGAALETSMDRLDELAPEKILSLLDGYLEQLNASKSDGHDAMARYRLELIFGHLDSANGVGIDEIAKREFALFPLIQHGKRPLALHRLMASSGSFYASVLEMIFPPEPADPLTEEQKKRRRDLSSLAYRLLSDFEAAPATDGLGSALNQVALEEWISAVRAANKDPERNSLYDVYIGQALAHAPHDDDGGWPHRIVRDVIEVLQADDIERGIATERFNMRGVFMKSIFEGGAQERDLAQKYRSWSELAASWIRTSALLENIAKRWDAGAEEADLRAKQDMMRE